MSHTPKNITDPDNYVDPWFKHDPNEPHHQKSHGDFNSPGVYLALGATVAVTFGVAVVVIIWFIGLVNEQQTRVQEQSDYVTAEKVNFFTTWEEELYGDPEWIDQNTGTVRLNINQSMRRVIDRYAENR